MKIPKGNLFLKETALEFDDVTIMVENLKANGFNGYVKFDLPQLSELLFLREGIATCVIELNSNNYTMIHESILNYKLRNTECKVSTYILSPEMIEILASLYAYKEVYVNYKINKKELRQILEILEQNKYTGIMEIQKTQEPTFILFSRGTVITDQFLERYGEIISGTESISQLFETITNQGSTINAYAEKADEIERKKRICQEYLAQVKELVVGVETGLLKGGNAAKIDEVVFKEWQKSGEVTQVEIQTESGIIEYAKVTAVKNKGMKILLPPAMLKKIKINKDEMVLVKPLFS